MLHDGLSRLEVSTTIIRVMSSPKRRPVSPEKSGSGTHLNGLSDSIAKPPHAEDDSSSLPTLEAMAGERRKRSQVSTQAMDNTSSTSTALSRAQEARPPTDNEPPRTPQEYEDEAGQEGAFNPETGEINWDCPCLGGMAHGPCGEQFKAAFSCFVFSKEEPKGMDCIDKFKYVTLQQQCKLDIMPLWPISRSYS